MGALLVLILGKNKVGLVLPVGDAQVHKARGCRGLPVEI